MGKHVLARSQVLETPTRKVELPVDVLGRERWRATLDQRSVERRAEGEPIGFKGHAAMFNRRTWIGPKRWGFFEQVAPGAFSKTLGEADVRFLVNHDPNLLLARNKAGTLRLSEDDAGLATDADMAPVSYAQDLAVLLERGDISQMSFAFETVKDQWETLDDDNELRTLLEVRLWDVSVVTYPAYEDTDAGLRGAAFDQLCRAASLDEASQTRLLHSLTQEPSSEPPQRTRAHQPDDPTGDPTNDIRLRFTQRAAQRVASLERYAS